MKKLLLSLIMVVAMQVNAWAYLLIIIDTTGWTDQQRNMRTEALLSIAGEVDCLSTPSIVGDEIRYYQEPVCFDVTQLSSSFLLTRINALIDAGVVSQLDYQDQMNTFESQIRARLSFTEDEWSIFLQVIHYRFFPPLGL